ARTEALPSAAEVAGQLEVQRRVVEAVAALEEPYRSTVVHRFLHGRSVAEIAAAVGVPRKTVESRLTRALAMLRGRLDAGPGGRRAWSVALLPLAWPRSGVGGIVGGVVMTAKAKSLVAAALLALLGFGVVGVAALSRDRDPSASRAEAPRGHDARTLPVIEEQGAVAEGGAVSVVGPDARGEPARLHPVPEAPPGTLIGRITCADGSPAAGARVRVLGSLTKDGVTRVDDGGYTLEIETVADENGVYRVERLAAGSYQVRATHVGHAPSERYGQGHYVSATRGAEISIQLKLGGTLRVLVRDVAGGAVPGVEVELLAGFVIRDGQEPLARAVSDESGMAVLGHLAEGGTIRVRAEGESHERRMILVYDKVTTLVELVIGAVLTGDVALEDGTPLRDGKVVCYGPMSGSSATQAEALTDPSGRYRLPWLTPGEYEVCVRGPGVAGGHRRIIVGPEPVVTAHLRLGRSIVSGGVRREGPAPGGVVPVDAHGVPVPRLLEVRLTSPGKTPLWVSATPDGRFAFFDVPPGDYALETRDDEGLVASVPVIVGRGERVERKELVLRRAYGEVELELLDAKGAFNGRVQLYLDHTSIAPPAIGAGRYRFEALTGRRTVTVQWAGGSGSTKVDLDVEEGKTVYKTVRLPE
ncbi:MAG: carboxypeptidase regulatory-like domain-containing protein, partial [Planctomycetes bacterium]|nr:carboxypeptidase regulatory-like domain-containing protein [Planctomycetota bacterium]